MIDETLLFPNGKHVAIVFCGNTWEQAPFFDVQWTCWSIPSNWQRFEHLTDGGWAPHLWFDIHRDETWQEKKDWHPAYQGWLAQLKQPIVMARPQPAVPTSVGYPFEEVYANFRCAGPGAGLAPFVYPDPILTPIGGTVDWMIALALTAGAERIALYGVDYNSAHEQVYQWPSVCFWCGVAKGMGRPIELPPKCRLLTGPLVGQYGPDFPPWPPGHHPYLERWEGLGNLRGRGKPRF